MAIHDAIMAPSPLGCASLLRNPPPFAVAKQARDRGSVSLALQVVQERLDAFKKPGTGGWGNKRVGLLQALRSEQPEGEVRGGLAKLLSEMDTSR